MLSFSRVLYILKRTQIYFQHVTVIFVKLKVQLGRLCTDFHNVESSLIGCTHKITPESKIFFGIIPSKFHQSLIQTFSTSDSDVIKWIKLIKFSSFLGTMEVCHLAHLQFRTLLDDQRCLIENGLKMCSQLEQESPL